MSEKIKIPKIDAIRIVKREAERFFAALQSFEKTDHYKTIAGQAKKGEAFAYSSREMGRLKRASLDLSEALVWLRQSQ
jgi:hypothetical protein